jgi:hypothetical protein
MFYIFIYSGIRETRVDQADRSVWNRKVRRGLLQVRSDISTSFSDPHSLNPDPGFLVNMDPDRIEIHVFDFQKFETFIAQKKIKLPVVDQKI